MENSKSIINNVSYKSIAKTFNVTEEYNNNLYVITKKDNRYFMFLKENESVVCVDCTTHQKLDKFGFYKGIIDCIDTRETIKSESINYFV